VSVTMGMLLAAMIQVESHGNNHAVGDEGRAIGCLQITRAVLADVNRAYRTEYILRDCYDRGKSVKICRNYLTLWGRKYEDETGTSATAQVLARIWNGGPRGWNKPETQAYWHKVKAELERMQA